MTDTWSTERTQGYGKASGPRAGFWRRFGAVIIDAILVGIIEVVLDLALKGAGSAISVVINAIYFTYFIGSDSGATPGKMVLGIRVVDQNTGGPIGYGRAFIRWIGHIVSAVVLLLGYFWMLWDPEKQCWHDKFAGDIVVPPADYQVAQTRR
jgi:uncharacterized RDD family membrane protein YckC